MDGPAVRSSRGQSPCVASCPRVAVPQFFLRVTGEFADDQGGLARPPAGRILEEKIDIPEAALAGLPF